MSNGNVDVSPLTAMGFPEEQCIEALAVSSGNLEAAVNYLLSGGSDGGGGNILGGGNVGNSAHASSISGPMIIAPISQYSLGDGRSACTCIALKVAAHFLKDPPINDHAHPTPGLLREIIENGVASYQHIQQSGQVSGSVEHLSAEEVLQGSNEFPLQMMSGGVRQGLLSHDRHHPMGLGSVLQGIRGEQESGSPSKWMAILMTKTPETIVVLFPPPTSASSTMSFWILDSHPRPSLGASGAYAQAHPTFDSLVEVLRSVFPCTDLGPDVPEMMAMMYNSFDLYPLFYDESRR